MWTRIGIELSFHLRDSAEKALADGLEAAIKQLKFMYADDLPPLTGFIRIVRNAVRLGPSQKGIRGWQGSVFRSSNSSTIYARQMEC